MFRRDSKCACRDFSSYDASVDHRDLDRLVHTSSFGLGSGDTSGVFDALAIRLSLLPRDDLGLSKLFAELIAFELS